MSFDPINPVALVASAATGVGAACAREMARRADGGLVLADYDEAALEACADSLERAPERVSTLAFAPNDKLRWTHAADFVAAHYGRLDWALLDAGAAFPRRDNYLEITQRGLHALMPLIGDNRDGGAIVLLASAAALREEFDADPDGAGGLLALLRDAARKGEQIQVRVSALAFGMADSETWPLFSDLAGQDAQSAAFAALAGLTPPVARYPGADLSTLLPLILAEGLGGGVLVADGGHTL
jgi:NAD(P)-dependent dehydrogenase (short-subunit alcohol dehydrogenase family)